MGDEPGPLDHWVFYATRDLDTIDAELRLVSRAWRVAREMGWSPSTVHIDALLDERRELTES